MSIQYTQIVKTLPSSVPFVGPEAQERRLGKNFEARIGANESVFGPSPKAVLAIQGDHGGGFGKNDLEIQQDVLKTFTLLKINNTHCKNFDLSNKLDMINTARLLLSCATNQEPNLLEKKSYLKINDRLVEY